MITRFAPSPTGPLHLGHAYSAMLAHDLARAENGVFLLRIEDIDQSRARSHWEAQIHDDLHWLGLTWPAPVMRQSQRQPAYDAALDRLWSEGLLFVCTCTRRDIFEAVAAPQEGAAHLGPDGLVYPGTCRPRAPEPGSRPRGQTLRLDMAKALSRLTQTGSACVATFDETGAGPKGETGRIAVHADHCIATVGDVVLARRDMQTSYHLSVVIDDAAQGITHVVRGQDLFDATGIHVLMQNLLDLPTPAYHHHRLIRDAAGRRLAKRDDSRALSIYRSEGATPADIRRMVGLPD